MLKLSIKIKSGNKTHRFNINVVDVCLLLLFIKSLYVRPVDKGGFV